MRAITKALAGLLLLTSVAPSSAQDEGGDDGGGGEIIVTGARLLRPDRDAVTVRDIVASMPAPSQMLRRTADFAVQQVVVIGDSTDEAKRRDEIYAMTRNAIAAAGANNVQVATGELVVEPLTVANHRDLKIAEDDDSGGEYVLFLVKTPLAPGVDAKTALDRIARFMKAVPAVGRAQIKPWSELTLSVVKPEQYHGAIIDLVAKEALATSGRFGAGYGVEVGGLDRSVAWKRASLTEVYLYLPSDSKIRPRN